MNMHNELTRPVFLGWTDEVSACDCCGKSGLKATAALEVDGETVFYGSTCAARALTERTGQRVTAAKVRRETEAAHALQVECGKAFDRGLWAREFDAACAATMAHPDRAAAWFIGHTTQGGFWSSVGAGPRYVRFESNDLEAVIAWVRANRSADYARETARLAARG